MAQAPAQVLGAEIVRQARIFLHLQEVVPNRKWDDPRTPEPEKALSELLSKEMQSAGWPPGAPYCAAFAEAVSVLAMRRLGVDEWSIFVYRKAFTPHCVTTFNNFQKLGAVSSVPAIGGVGLARWGKTSRGHCWVAVQPSKTFESMATIEGNTSAQFISHAKERQGDGIYERTRNTRQNGQLKTLGFVNPAHILGL